MCARARAGTRTHKRSASPFFSVTYIFQNREESIWGDDDDDDAIYGTDTKDDEERHALLNPDDGC